jgi:transposase
MALVVLSKVEQRFDAVRAVLAGASVTVVAAAAGVSRVSVHAWLRRYVVEGLRGWRTGHTSRGRVLIKR